MTQRQTEDLSFEAAMDSLESIVVSLEDQQLSLEDMVSSYEEGMKLLKVCRARIDRAQKRVESIHIHLENELKVTTKEFDASESSAPEAASLQGEEVRKKAKKKNSQEDDHREDEIRLF